MTRAHLGWAVIGALGAAAAPASAEPVKVHRLATSQHHIDLEAHGQRYGAIDYLRVITPSPIASAQLDAALADMAHALGWLDATQQPHGMFESDCELGFATEQLLSVQCSTFRDDGPNTGGSVRIVDTASFFLDRDQLRPATPATLFTPATAELPAKLAALSGHHDATDAPCQVALDRQTQLFILPDGIDFHDEYVRRGCTLDWEALKPLLSPALQAIVEAEVIVDDAPAERTGDALDARLAAAWSHATPRFIAGPGDTVVDRATDLMWTGHDNGKDLTFAEAKIYAQSSRTAGFTDWRLPTEAELERLATPELAHHERTDCTHGKLATVLAPELHPSCGIAWTSTPFGDSRAITFGLISGAARLSKPTDKHNHRALLVRSAAAAKPAMP